MKQLLPLISILLAVQTVSAQQLAVPGEYSTIQAAIEAASEGDTVLVAEGTYFENVNFLGKAITVASRFILDGDTSHISNTIIDGSQAADPENASVVTLISGEDTTSVLMGFTIQGGTGTKVTAGGYTDYYGGGIVIEKSGGKIVHNIIEENHVNVSAGFYLYGGGIGGNVYGKHTVIIRKNTIRYNKVEGEDAMGGGIYLTGGSILIDGNTISNNSTYATGSDGGAGIFWAHFNFPGVIYEVTISNNLIDSNTSHVTRGFCGGGGVYTGLGMIPRVKLFNNVIINNSVAGRGGGIFNWENAMVLINNTILNNSSGMEGNSIAHRKGQAIYMNNIIWSGIENDQVDVYYKEEETSRVWIYNNDFRDSLELGPEFTGSGNIFIEPQFSPGFYEPAHKCLLVGSGIDSVQVSGFWFKSPPKDFHGNSRPHAADDRVDIGAIESPFTTESISEKTGFQDLALFPNPTCSHVSVNMGEPGVYSIALTSLNGQLLFDIESEGATHQLDLSSLEKGVYLITIRSENFVTTRKIVKL